MTDIENYHNWLRDAHAMEKQAEVILITATRRSENYPPLRTRLEQHLYETRRQLSSLQDIIARNHISRSALQDAMSRVAALGQSIGMMLPGDEVIKVIITAYVFAQFEVACYTALLTAAKRVGDHHAIHAPRRCWRRSEAWLTGCFIISRRSSGNFCIVPICTALRPENKPPEKNYG